MENAARRGVDRSEVEVRRLTSVGSTAESCTLQLQQQQNDEIRRIEKSTYQA